jgi:hypothetical protein
MQHTIMADIIASATAINPAIAAIEVVTAIYSTLGALHSFYHISQVKSSSPRARRRSAISGRQHRFNIINMPLTSRGDMTSSDLRSVRKHPRVIESDSESPPQGSHIGAGAAVGSFGTPQTIGRFGRTEVGHKY